MPRPIVCPALAAPEVVGVAEEVELELVVPVLVPQLLSLTHSAEPSRSPRR